MVAVEPGWNESVDRPTRTIDGCLVQQTIAGEVAFPSKAVLLCGQAGCPARSDHVGQMPCKGIGA